jgi:hypothetical protein
MDRKAATIRKWYGTWGIAHSFVSPSIPPRKFFIHINNLQSPAVLDLGVEISFVEGAPRTVKELPTALEIGVMPPVVKAAGPLASLKKTEVKSSPEVGQ